jgi:hypothetical protein
MEKAKIIFNQKFIPHFQNTVIPSVKQTVCSKEFYENALEQIQIECGKFSKQYDLAAKW